MRSIPLSFHLTLPLIFSSLAFAETISVDANANRHPIDPRIYGVAHAGTTALNDLNTPLNRNGGNNTSRYNWQQNADNRGNDWYYESIGDPSSTAGERGDTFIANSKAANAQAMLTIPMVGWVGKVGANRSKLCSFSIAKYGAQTGSDWQWFPDAGNGVLSNGQNVTGNDPNDANVAADSAFQQSWVQHIVSQWGTAANGGLRYYILDNEHSIWHSTHRDVHPTGATMDEIKNKMVDYATKIKAIDSGALVVGPEEWGWSGYLYSGYDQQYGSLHGWSTLPDRNNHGGWDYMPWLLDQLRQASSSSGKRLLDVFTLHYYPQGGEFSDDTSSAMQSRRNRSTRSLWDPNYVDETWINTQVKLIPRMKGWVATYYPSTPVGITEYNWGAEGHINGATTQADIYGIFGREGLDMATRWTTPDPSTPTYKAMKIYRNYDGNKSTFGDSSCAATVTNPDNLSSFAAVRGSDGAMTVIVINKTTSSNSVTINLANFSATSAAQVWQLTSANTISRLSDLAVSSNSLTTTVPAQSVTLFVIPAGTGPTAPAAPSNLVATAASTSQINLTWSDNSGNETGFKLERKTGAGGTYAQIATPGSNVTSYSDSGLSAGTQYYYRIRATNAVGDSAYSNEASATTQVTQGPYGGTARPIPGTIQVEDFDVGGEGIAYHDLDTANQGGQYRASEGVDIEACTDTGGGYDVGWISTGEWLEYTVNVTAGTYNLEVRAASAGSGGTLHIEFNGVDKTGALTMPVTGGWQTWTSVTKTGITLSAGTQVMKIAIDSGGYNLNYVRFSTPVANQPPTVATAASASPNPATGTTTNLSVLGADDGGEAALVYTWATTGTPPEPVTFSANGTNAAKNTIATFTKAGSYSFQVTIKDAGNLTTTSSVNVTVNQTLTTISVSPASASVTTGATQQFSATGSDQFGVTLSSQPVFSWAVSGGGTVSSSGLFTAGSSAGGPFTVTATSGGKSGNASVTVTASVSFTVTINSVASGKAYSLANAQVGALQYIDRSYTISSLSANLNGGVMIRQANDDKNLTVANQVTFTVNQNAMVYVCYDRRTKSLPAWLSGWTLSAEAISTTDNAASPMKVYSKSFAAGSVTLGGNMQSPASGAMTNYIPIVKPSAQIRAVGSRAIEIADEGQIPHGKWIHDGDSDGDGLLDDFELSVGLDPNTADTGNTGISDEEKIASSGLTYFDLQAMKLNGNGNGNGGNGTPSQPLTIKHVRGTIGLVSGKDICSLSGSINGFTGPLSLAGATIEVQVGGATVEFTLDKGGRAKTDAGTIHLGPARKTGELPFSAVVRAPLTSLRAEPAVATPNKAAHLDVTCTISFGGVSYTATIETICNSSSAKAIFKR